MTNHQFLSDLNPNQHRAVTTPNDCILQIIAGPGTGKTKVLISRVAYLLLHEQIPPEKIIVTTFTKKAASEMMERLGKLLGDTFDISKLIIGTFHSICFRIIKRYGGRMGLASFNIANENDSDKVLKEVFKNLSKDEIETIRNMEQSPDMTALSAVNSNSDSKCYGLDLKRVKRAISSLKSKGITHEFYNSANDSNKVLRFLYFNYQERLRVNLLLDFDDCLLYCYRLITGYPVLAFVQHVLIDEFQDTNEIQLQLMYAFARGHPTTKKTQNNLTIVGDPDQSIYSFRDAQSINFEKMRDHYKSVLQITLDENYRSTSDVLNFSEQMMRQQQKRTLKSLKSHMPHSFKPVYAKLQNSTEEARWMSYQIASLAKFPNSAVNYSDIAILVRSSFQTRAIEDELRKSKIPYLIVKGKAFWERKEVVAVLDYLRVVANKSDRIALLRILNYPKRGIGEKTMAAIEQRLEELCNGKNGTAFDCFIRVVEEVKLSSRSKEALKKLIDFAQEASVLLSQISDEDRTTQVNRLFEYVYENSGLKAEFKEDPSQDLNVHEVRQQLCEFVPSNNEIWGGEPDEDAEEEEVMNIEEEPNLISSFIQSIGLYETDPKIKEDVDGSRGRVAISTIHGSKGLEWPVVFVPGLSENMLPARFAIMSQSEEAINEERRCFYVSTTRAKVLLYLSSYQYYSQNGGNASPQCEESRFIRGSLGSTVSSQDSFRDEQSLRKLYGLLSQSELYTPSAVNFYKEYQAGLSEFESREYDDYHEANDWNSADSRKSDYQSISSASVSRKFASPHVNTHRTPSNALQRANGTTPSIPKKAPTYEIKRKRSVPLGPVASKQFKPFLAPRFVNKEKTTFPLIATSKLTPSIKMAPTYIPDRKKK